MKNETGIYVIINRVNGKIYVGSAVSFRRRWKQHRRQLDRGTHHSAKLQNAWNKHGGDAFSFTVERWCDKHELLRFEQDVIDLLKPEYNMTQNAGISQLGAIRTEKFKEAVRASNIKRAKKYHGKTIRQLVDHYGNIVTVSTAEMRVRRGWDAIEAVTRPMIPFTETRAGKKKK